MVIISRQSDRGFPIRESKETFGDGVVALTGTAHRRWLPESYSLPPLGITTLLNLI